MTKFKNNIECDYAEYCRNKLKCIDPDYSEDRIEKAILDYHRYKFRIISCIKRKVFIPDNIKVPKKNKNSFNKIISIIENGKSLIPYQSKLIKNVNYDDNLLMDWGIHHLHIGDNLQSDGYIKRTKELLFLRITNNAAYIIGVFNHGEWSSLDHIEVLHKNWPESISMYKCESIIELSWVPDEDDIKKSRNNQLNTSIQLSDGTIYMGPGGGITSAGTPTKVTEDILYLKRIFRQSFAYITDHWTEIISQLMVKNIPDEVTIGIALEEGKLVYLLKEINKKIVLDS